MIPFPGDIRRTSRTAPDAIPTTIDRGRPRSHVCEDCHNVAAWAPVDRVDHAQVLGSCSSCHNGALATGKNNGHFVTTQECNICHDADAWAPDIYMHSGLSYEPLDHRGNLRCTKCHLSNSDSVPWRYPAYQPDCAGCHTNRYKQGPHKKTESPATKYTVGELADCAGACHVYTDSSLSKIKKRRNGPEHRVSRGDF